jgi:hypothetical protein
MYEDDNRNEDVLLVQFHKRGIVVQTLVHPLRRDEAKDLAKAYILKIGLDIGNDWSCEISTAPKMN